MKNSTKVGLVVALLGTLGAGSLVKVLNATPASWQSLAKITPQQAQQAAEKAVGGQATRVQLENEDGNLVYSVIIGQNDVKVDAGNGRVLYTDSLQAETDESKRPHSSIRISEGPEGDGDGEIDEDLLNDRDTEVQDDQIPQALKDVGEYGERVYDMAKTADWTKTQADLAALKQSAQQLSHQMPNDSLGISQLNASIERLQQAVTANNQQTTQQLANQITLLAAQMTQPYQTKVPVEITLLDYYGRQLEIDAARGNLNQLQATVGQIDQTWNTVRPVLLSHGGNAEVQQFNSLVIKLNQDKSVNDYSPLATSVLDQVDRLEAVFK